MVETLHEWIGYIEAFLTPSAKIYHLISSSCKLLDYCMAFFKQL